MTNCNEPPKILPDWKKVLVSREEFLKALGLAASGLMALIVAIPGAAFVFQYLFIPERRPWVSVGTADSFKDGETQKVIFDEPYRLSWDGVSGRRSAWLRRVSETEFIVFAVNCTHLGCPVRWESGADLFLCPCHGGVFDSNGDVAAGPPPRPMHRYPVRLNNGQVEISLDPVLTEGPA